VIFDVLIPEIVLTVVALGLLLAAAWQKEGQSGSYLGYLGIVGLLGALVALWPAIGISGEVFDGMLVADELTMFFKALLIVVGILVFLMSIEFVEKNHIPAGEYYALLLFGIVGGMIMVASADLLAFYVGLELLAIASYALTGMLRNDHKSQEAVLKYFLNGALASAIILFGISLFYGLTGTTSIQGLADAFKVGVNGTDSLVMAALVFLMAGFGFKIAAVPFHLWAADTYEGAPTPITAFLSVVSKGAAFVVMMRIFFVGLESLTVNWSAAFAVLAVITMTVGNLAALWQKNIKRMLAYSSIAHAGYIMVGFAAATADGLTGMTYYILAYALTNMGLFAIIVAMSNAGLGEDIDGYKGLSRKNALYAWMMVVFFLSLIGIPPTGGFLGKFLLFKASIGANLVWLALAMAINSAISVGYYYGVVKTMFLNEEEEEEPQKLPTTANIGLVVWITGAMVLVLGILPSFFIELSSQVAKILP